MIKKMVCIFIGVVCSLSLTACGIGGEMLETTNDTDFKILINSGSVFVYEFKDADTGVWDICGSKGITPKLNADGSLYTEVE